MKLKKCPDCGEYSLSEKCTCGGETKSAHYKFIKIKDVVKTKFFGKFRS